MTALAKIKSRGTVFAQSVSSAFVAMAGLVSIDITGAKSKTTDTTTLDGPETETKNGTGYAAAAGIKLHGHYDPAHPTYTNFEPLIISQTPTDFKITLTDVAPTSAVYHGVGFGCDKKVAPDKMVMADLEIETSGNPS